MTFLIYLAAGGAGQIAVQLAKLAGNHVIGTCSNDDKVAMLKVSKLILKTLFQGNSMHRS